MLDERRATALSYDAKTDIVKISFEHSRLHAESKTFPSAMKGTLLIDTKGFLVGVDLGGGGSRAIVMLGAHEDVHRTVESSIVITRVGNADGYEVQIPHAKAQVRANEKSPYL